jgi:hypothetical protein
VPDGGLGKTHSLLEPITEAVISSFVCFISLVLLVISFSAIIGFSAEPA